MDSSFVEHIPHQAGVYFFKDKRESILYIGKAKNLQKRIQQYFSPGSLRKQDMIQKAEKVDFVVVQNESEALYLEDNLIKKHKPEYNNLLKADNSYAYLKITKEPFAQIFLTRKKRNDGSLYIGPKHNSMMLKKFLQYLRQFLAYRGCKTNQFNQHKLCSDYYFGLCKGRCALAQSEKLQGLKIEEAQDQYKKIISLIKDFFEGKTDILNQEIKKEIEEAARHHRFERAAKLRDVYLKLDEFSQQQTVVLPKQLSGYAYKLQHIASWWTYVLVFFSQGKLIDIVRSKVSDEDHDPHNIKSILEAELGEFFVLGSSSSKQKKVKSTSTLHHSDDFTETIFVQKDLKKLNKGELGELHKLMDGFLQSFVVSSSFEDENLVGPLLKELQAKYFLKTFPFTLEAVDISHLQSGWASGGLVAMKGGIMNYKGYRRYKISQDHAGDDYASLKEVLVRRYKLDQKHPAEDLPDVLLIDGGKGQLHVVEELEKEYPNAKEVFEKISVISLGKGEARKRSNRGRKNDELIAEKIYMRTDEKIRSIPLAYSDSDKLLLMLRNEAHRFSNSYRKKQMEKERTTPKGGESN